MFLSKLFSCVQISFLQPFGTDAGVGYDVFGSLRLRIGGRGETRPIGSQAQFLGAGEHDSCGFLIVAFTEQLCVQPLSRSILAAEKWIQGAVGKSEIRDRSL